MCQGLGPKENDEISEIDRINIDRHEHSEDKYKKPHLSHLMADNANIMQYTEYAIIQYTIL